VKEKDPGEKYVERRKAEEEDEPEDEERSAARTAALALGIIAALGILLWLVYSLVFP
jgi:hypothetical protein